jgi:hypothetical protein
MAASCLGKLLINEKLISIVQKRSIEMKSVKRLARVTGLLYLVIFIVAPFAFLLVRSTILVPGDATATAENILASESLFRTGMAAESVVFLVEIVLAAILYVLLRPVSRSLSLAAAFSRLAEAIVQAVNLITSILVLLLVSGAGYLAVFESDQLASLGMLFLKANEFVILLWGVFFGFHLLLLGYLVYKSGFWPRILGILLVLASLGYLAQSYGHILAPQYDDALATIVLVLTIPGELAFTVWLLWKGIDVEQWEKRALEPAL